MRVKSTIINSTFNIIAQIIQLVLSFIVRNLFIKYIGIEFLGLSGLFTNILSALNLAELGVGTAITYYLYKPMTEMDKGKIKGLMIFYRKLYYSIGMFVIVIGLLILPFIQFFIKDQSLDLPYIRVLFLIQLAGTASTYFLAYKRTLLFVDQKNYIASIVDSSMNIVMMIVRVGALIYLKSYVAYSIVILLQTVLGNVIISNICNKQYDFLKDKQLSAEHIDRKIVFRDLRNIVVERIVHYIHYSTDNILISKFIGLVSTGLLANYTLIYSTVQTFIGQITNAVHASLGNYINSGNKDRDVYIVFKRFSFLCYLCSSFSVVSFLILIQPFIDLWLGEKFILPYYIIIILSISFFISVMRVPLIQMIYIYGLFKEMKYVAILAATVNLTISVVMIQFIGVAGTLLGTLASEVIFYIGQSYYVISKRLKVPISKSFRDMGFFILAALILAMATMLISLLFRTNSILTFIGRTFLCMVIPNVLNILFFRNTDELIYYKNLFIIAYNKGFDKIRKRVKQ